MIATSFGTPYGERDAHRTWTYEEDGAGYRLFPRNGPWAYNLSIQLTRWVFAHARDYDVLHVHAPFSYTTLPACAAAVRARKPYIYRTLGTMDAWSLGQKAWKKWPYYRVFERRNMAGAAAVHVTAESERRAIAALGFGSKATDVPLAVDVAPPVKRHASAGPLRVLYLSRLHEKKGIPHLLEALKVLRNRAPGSIRLTLAGTGAPRYEAEVNELIARLGLGDVIDRPGFVDGEAKQRVLGDSDVFVLPAYDENFGIAVVEAMAAGLPVVVSDAVGVAPDVEQGNAGVVVRTGNTDDIVAALERLRDAGTREAMGRAARGVVDDRFTTAAMGARLVAMYERAKATSLDADALRGHRDPR